MREAALGRRAWGADAEGGRDESCGVFCLDSVSVCPCLTVFFSRFLN
jgi:hypothetical protein